MDFGLPHLLSIGGYLQAHLKVRVEILDLNYEGGDHRHLQRRLEELGPFLTIGLSCYSSFDYLRVMALGRFVKQLYPDVPLVSGGYHASALSEDLLFDGSPFDVVFRGEGELPMRQMVEKLLAGETIERGAIAPQHVTNIDDLPPYRWELLSHYWPRALDIGRKFQIYLSRGCPYHCTFCMERAKGDYRWRGYSAQRAVEELERLKQFTDLSQWVVNVADPLFGFPRAWRREFLQGVISRGLLPRQYWTLTRADDLDEEDVELLAKANFSIGIGMESGSETMLKIMNKTKSPGRYLEALGRLALLSRKHGLNWAGNIIVGHPGETHQTMRETRDFLLGLFTSAKETCGWLSIDPFRFYPGSQVHEELMTYEKEFGTQVHHPQWWKSWYDGSFRAEHVEPSSSLSFADRVNFMYEAYPPVIDEIHQRFRGQGRSVDQVFRRSLDEQRLQMSDAARQDLLRRAEYARGGFGNSATPAELSLPIGLQIKDASVRRREDAVRRLLQGGVLRSESIVAALLSVRAEDFLSEPEADAMYRDRLPDIKTEGLAPPWLSISAYALALEAFNPSAGMRMADLLGQRGYFAALLAALVGDDGQVQVLCSEGRRTKRALAKQLKGFKQVNVIAGAATEVEGLAGDFDGVFFPGALPAIPTSWQKLLLDNGGQVVTFVGPRFGVQDMVAAIQRNGAMGERVIARMRVPIVAGLHGWLRA